MPGNAPPTTRLVKDTGLRLVTLAGADATAFLHAQAMTPLADRETNRLVTCGIADNKGRVIALATAWHINGDWKLFVPADQAEWLVEHLMRFRFRSRVEIEAPGERKAMAVFDEAAGAKLESGGLSVPATGHVVTKHSTSVLALPNGRYLVSDTAEALRALCDTLATGGTVVDPTYWRGLCMQSGDIAIYAATRGKFLPQWLNLDRAEDVIGWNKGCYPGQEVIARLQHRGEVKRRMILLATDINAAPGEKTDESGITVEIVDKGRLTDGSPVTQVVAPCPFDHALESLAL